MGYGSFSLKVNIIRRSFRFTLVGVKLLIANSYPLSKYAWNRSGGPEVPENGTTLVGGHRRTGCPHRGTAAHAADTSSKSIFPSVDTYIESATFRTLIWWTRYALVSRVCGSGGLHQEDLIWRFSSTW